MKNVSVLSGRPLPRDSKMIRPDQPNEILESVQQTVVMVTTQSETIAERCREECTRLEREVSTTVSRIRQLTIERPLPQSER
jgi:hypothetical protein